ncbi:hypothetical protein [Amnibacterium endophyticum]|uniref:Uncharacterized protein n=1 Tax=Amnibacterium endophyticum TaxID=2109337 RepID=A0ABW4LJG3_9MICO
MRAAPVAAALALAVALAGCSASPLVAHRRGGTAADPAALLKAWSTPATQPGWLPEDATRIRWVASTRGGADRAAAVLEARSAGPLPDSCTALPDGRGAAIGAAWAPQRVPAEVRRCGNWAVTAIDGGYYGWTPVDAAAATG